MYAIVKTGGKQYRVQEGESLLVERLPVDDGATFDLVPLLYVDGSEVVDGDGLAKVTVQARVLAHERGPKLRIVKFKPKRGYKRRNGHRQELTRIEITSLKLSSGRRRRAASASEGTQGSEGSPQGSEGTPPVSEGTPPVSEATPPVSEATPPVSEGTPPASEGSSADATKGAPRSPTATVEATDGT
jgi:large subunit ribosomal protein L21